MAFTQLVWHRLAHCKGRSSTATQEVKTERESNVRCSERLRRLVLERCRSESVDRGNKTY